MSESEEPKAVELRASDNDRRRVATILHEALGRGQLTIEEFDERTAQTWAAKYTSELTPLTADLQAPSTTRSVTPYDAHPPASARVTGDGGPSFAFAMFGGFDRKGVWTIPATFNAVAIMGGGTIDLRYANLGAREVTINAVAIMGGIDIIVPDDVVVKEHGIGIMGAFDDSRKWDTAPSPLPSDAPVITVRGMALMGGVTIQRKPSGPVKRIEGQ